MIEQKYIDRLWSNVTRNAGDGCWEWTGWKTVKGYGVMQMGRGRAMRVHRLSWLVHNGELASDALVCHRCDNPSCVRPSHLFVGTSKDNNDDMLRKGRQRWCFGESNGVSIITAEQARSIYLDPRLRREIAADHNICLSLVTEIKRRHLWSHATADLPDQPRRKSGPRQMMATP